MAPVFPVQRVRELFPALNDGRGSLFFDNAAGTQVPRRVLDAVVDHLLHRNVQRAGPYRQSQEVDSTISHARQAVALLLNASDPAEVAFGMNATSFIRLVSLAVGQTLGNRSEIIVTDLDHEANIATWLALQREGAVIHWWKVREDGNLYVRDLEPLLSSKTRLLACTAASNAVGTLADVVGVAQRVHAAGAELFVDAVHFAPHGTIDVQAWGCDYLVCSGYKIFAPHMGFLWGRREALEALPTFREEFIPNVPPDKIEVGTFVYENVAGMHAAIEYLAELGTHIGGQGSSRPSRKNLFHAMEAIREYEIGLASALLEGLSTIKGVTIYGIEDKKHVQKRVPTICFNLAGVPSNEVAAKLATRDIAVRDGNMYSPRLMARLGIGDRGAVRASLVHYNTQEEIGRLIDELEQIAQLSPHRAAHST